MSVKSKVTFYRAKPEWTRAFFAPLALQHSVTQEEFEEFNVFKFAEFVFRDDDGAPFPEVDGSECDNTEIQYHDIEISNFALAVQFVTSDHKGGRILATASAHPLQFRKYYSSDMLNPIPATIRKQFFSAVDQIWDYLVFDFRGLTRVGSLEIFARINSPTAPFEEIAPDAFEHFEIVDWERGVAEARSGERLFSIHAHRPTRVLATPMAPQRDRSRPQTDRATVLIAKLWGAPPDRVAVTNSELVAKVSKAAEDHGYPVPGRDSIMRAANRATDRRQRK